MTLQHKIVGGIPLLWIEPQPGTGRTLAIWLPGFSGTKESVEPQLRDLAGAGFVALSYDPWQHGERRIETQEALSQRILGNIRRHFWPILAHTAEESSQVIDWAVTSLGVAPDVRMGGISMGGDIAVAAAGADRRIRAVAACVATPDWLRPGSFEAPGEPDADSLACYERRNPLTHLELYAHCPALSFQCGAMDAQVPPDGAQRFVAALQPAYRDCPERLEVCLHEGVAHAFTEAMWHNCLSWFQRW
ncbi:MAG TPA: prolyl oligopeptidase family serine peptidase [Abditibacteriaceae bacterium]|nr:prolyl oligopeptidase family serine peptidase [Abditibacteriaceae bacterium]